jgi:hypothetical protein
MGVHGVSCTSKIGTLGKKHDEPEDGLDLIGRPFHQSAFLLFLSSNPPGVLPPSYSFPYSFNLSPLLLTSSFSFEQRSFSRTTVQHEGLRRPSYFSNPLFLVR